MKEKTLKQTESVTSSSTVQEERPLLTEGPKQREKKRRMTLKLPGFQNLPVLTKFRVAVTTIFFLCTFAVLLIFVTEFIYPAILLIISYVLLFIFMVKLFLTKRL